MDDGNKANQISSNHIKNSRFLIFLEKMKRLVVGLTYLKGERPKEKGKKVFISQK